MNKNIFSRLWDTGTREVEVTFTGHKTAVSCLAWDRAGLRLVSGSRDTAVIVWDVVAECGIARLQGHKVRIITYILTSTLAPCRMRLDDRGWNRTLVTVEGMAGLNSRAELEHQQNNVQQDLCHLNKTGPLGLSCQNSMDNY